jgi:O6-methylguanine-DNA--protein-cysteine methyltransferase
MLTFQLNHIESPVGKLLLVTDSEHRVRALDFADHEAAIIVACHRVIGANGDLKGYAGGPHRKEWLLGHEKAVIPVSQKRGKTPRNAAVDNTANLPGF